jgi:hypothetical protein
LARRRDGEDWTCSEAGGPRPCSDFGLLPEGLHVLCCILLIFQGAFQKCRGVFVMPLFNPFNIYSPSQKKRTHAGCASMSREPPRMISNPSSTTMKFSLPEIVAGIRASSREQATNLHQSRGQPVAHNRRKPALLPMVQFVLRELSLQTKRDQPRVQNHLRWRPQREISSLLLPCTGASKVESF